jgi:hypothetical protein
MFVLLLGGGCAATRQAALDLTAEKIENAKVMRKISEECFSVCSLELGLLEGALGEDINDLPYESIKAIEELKALVEKTELSDYELGYFLGLHLRLSSSVVQVTIEKYAPEYAPEFLEYLALVF